MPSSSTNPAATIATATPKAKNIPNPRRLLILAPTTQSLSIIPLFLNSLTGVPVTDSPPADTTSETPTFAGYTTHSPLRLETKYYNTEVPVWVDEIPLVDAKEQWKTDFLSAEAEIVREAVGALVVCAHAPGHRPPLDSNDEHDPAEREDVRVLRDLMRGIGAVKEMIDEERGGVGDVPGIFVLVGSRTGDISSVSKPDPNGSDLGDGLGDNLGDVVPLSVGWWEDQFYDMGLVGWEVIEWDPKGGGEETRNQYGEREGMPRIKEVLETHDWSMASSGVEDTDSEDGLEDQLLGLSNSRGFGDEVHELEREMYGLRMAIERGGDDSEDEDEQVQDDGDCELDVESMEALMMRMQAIKDMGSDLPEDERKRFAAKAVQDIMREL